MKVRMMRRKDRLEVTVPSLFHASAELVSDERAEFHAALSKLLGTKWPVT